MNTVYNDHDTTHLHTPQQRGLTGVAEVLSCKGIAGAQGFTLGTQAHQGQSRGVLTVVRDLAVG